MKYHEALKAWNEEQKKAGAKKYIMPKKDSEEYKTVKQMCEAVKNPELKAPGHVVAPGPLDAYRGRAKE